MKTSQNVTCLNFHRKGEEVIQMSKKESNTNKQEGFSKMPIVCEEWTNAKLPKSV